MDRAYYADKMFEMLNDSETYDEIPSNTDKTVIKLIKELTLKHTVVLTV